ncbi:MAG: hypothetical protein JWN64_575 [Parcubacteria group bacterium]|nr:hypothetical protein [Parcubacteria group bacterium]
MTSITYSQDDKWFIEPDTIDQSRAMPTAFLFVEVFMNELLLANEELPYEAWDFRHCPGGEDGGNFVVHLLPKAGVWTNYFHVCNIELAETEEQLALHAQAAAYYFIKQQQRFTSGCIRHAKGSLVKMQSRNGERQKLLSTDKAKRLSINPFWFPHPLEE